VVEVVNTLGIEGFQDKHLPEGRARKHMDSVAYRLDTWARWIRENYVRDMKYSSTDADEDASGNKTALHASCPNYRERVCELNSSVSRFNADTTGPELNRSEGKVFILATV
jgi:D-lactate dehydrogenase